MLRTLGLCVLLAAAGCGAERGAPRVLVAASFHDAARAVLGDSAQFVPEASSTLARQIDAGAVADVFVSANAEWMDFLERRGRLVPDSRRRLVGNSIVLVAPKDSKRALADARRIAMGDPAHVPAGRYGRVALERAGLWARVAPRLLPTSDAREALALVQRDAVDFAIVYATDARASARVRVVRELDAEVVYEVAVLRGGDASIVARFFTAEARRIFQGLGFSVLP